MIECKINNNLDFEVYLFLLYNDLHILSTRFSTIGPKKNFLSTLISKAFKTPKFDAKTTVLDTKLALITPYNQRRF